MTTSDPRRGKARSFRDLRVWQEAQQLARAAGPVCEALCRVPYGDHADQLSRAVTSVHANIAEGWGRFGARDRLRFFDIAWASLQEVDSLLEEVARADRAPRPAVHRARLHASNTGRLLAALSASLRRPPPQDDRPSTP